MTELGVLPEDWELIPLSAVIKDLKSGVSVNSDIKNISNLYILKTSSVRNGKIILSEIKPVSYKDVKKVKCHLESDSIIISRMNTPELVGECGYSPTSSTYIFLPDRLWQTQASMRDTSFLWLTYLLTFDFYKKQIKELATGTSNSMKNITKEKFLSLVISSPPLPEQHAIAAALSDVDALLDAQERLIAKKRNIKLAAMQQLLTGKTRLPGFQQNGKYKQTELGILPEDWEVKMLGEGLSSKPAYGINAPACSYQKNFSAYIRITDITDDGKYIPAAYVQVKSNDFYLQDGDIVLARTGASVGKSYLYKSSDGQLVFAGFLIRIHPDGETFFPSYIFYYLHTSNYWKWVASTSMRSGQPGVNGQEYARLLLPCPPLPEQRAIAAVLSDMDAELAALEARRDKLRAVKQGMMRELLTGRTRLAGAGGRHGQ